MKHVLGNFGIMIATNTALFTALDISQWVAEHYALWSLPANLVAATIATGLAIGLGAAGRAFGVPNMQA